MLIDQTSRGFGIGFFTDANSVTCSIQVSSAARDEKLLWLGCVDPNPKRLIEGEGWVPIELDPNVMTTTRMHLTQSQVATLLPLLQHFVEHGDLPQPD